MASDLPRGRGRVLAIVQDPTTRTGRLGTRLKARGYELERRCPLAGEALPADPSPYAAVVVFGGPMSANDPLPGVHAQLDWIPSVLASGTPYLGVCLGAQLLARTLGAAVGPHPEGLAEVGYFQIRPTADGQGLFGGPLRVFHWHREGFELPPGAVHLAEGDRYRHQAFRYGPSAYGLQFHPEITAEILEIWMVKAADRLALPGAQAPEELRRNHARYDRAFGRWVDAFLDHWLGPA